MKALSLDLRERIASALASDPLSTYAGIAARFAVSTASVERISRKKRLGHSLTPGVSSGRPPLVAAEAYETFEKLAASKTDWTLQSLAAAWEAHSGKAVSITTTRRVLLNLRFAFKKVSHRQRTGRSQVCSLSGSDRRFGPQGFGVSG